MDLRQNLNAYKLLHLRQTVTLLDLCEAFKAGGGSVAQCSGQSGCKNAFKSRGAAHSVNTFSGAKVKVEIPQCENTITKSDTFQLFLIKVQMKFRSSDQMSNEAR